MRIVLDLDSSIHISGAQGSREWSIRIAASFAKGWIEVRAQVSLLTDKVDLPLAGGQLQVKRILDALAKLPRDSNRPFQEVMPALPRNRGSAGVTVVITTDLRNREKARGETSDVRWVVLKSRQFSPVPTTGVGLNQETLDINGASSAVAKCGIYGPSSLRTSQWMVGGSSWVIDRDGSSLHWPTLGRCSMWRYAEFIFS